MAATIEIPVIDLKGLTGDESERSRTMAQLHEAYEDWGFFWSLNSCTYTVLDR
ncbi:hypothetical protein EJB05_14954, partial [Eragrostis curvula]